jgi:hypothetical protein
MNVQLEIVAGFGDGARDAAHQRDAEIVGLTGLDEESRRQPRLRQRIDQETEPVRAAGNRQHGENARRTGRNLSGRASAPRS